MRTQWGPVRCATKTESERAAKTRKKKESYLLPGAMAINMLSTSAVIKKEEKETEKYIHIRRLERREK